jgi:hypothetical protein
MACKHRTSDLSISSTSPQNCESDHQFYLPAMSQMVVNNDNDPRITGNNIPYLPRRNGLFDVYGWLGYFHDADVPPLPVMLM